LDKKLKKEIEISDEENLNKIEKEIE